VPEGVETHPAPADSREAFAPGAILVVPLRIASGIRMKILEAWARGLPVVATPEAAAGLEAEDGRELLLAERHDPAAVSRRLLEIYGLVAEPRGTARSRSETPRE
jgi:glycosyltransferase involved in cell wall biosynthesis